MVTRFSIQRHGTPHLPFQEQEKISYLISPNRGFPINEITQKDETKSKSKARKR